MDIMKTASLLFFSLIGEEYRKWTMEPISVFLLYPSHCIRMFSKKLFNAFLSAHQWQNVFVIPPPPHSRQCVGLFFVQSKDETGVDHIELLVCWTAHIDADFLSIEGNAWIGTLGLTNINEHMWVEYFFLFFFLHQFAKGTKGCAMPNKQPSAKSMLLR